jgi:hypothetical protein
MNTSHTSQLRFVVAATLATLKSMSLSACGGEAPTSEEAAGNAAEQECLFLRADDEQNNLVFLKELKTISEAAITHFQSPHSIHLRAIAQKRLKTAFGSEFEALDSLAQFSAVNKEIISLISEDDQDLEIIETGFPDSVSANFIEYWVREGEALEIYVFENNDTGTLIATDLVSLNDSARQPASQFVSCGLVKGSAR